MDHVRSYVKLYGRLYDLSIIILQKNNFTTNPKKCYSYKKEIYFLGYIILAKNYKKKLQELRLLKIALN